MDDKCDPLDRVVMIQRKWREGVVSLSEAVSEFMMFAPTDVPVVTSAMSGDLLEALRKDLERWPRDDNEWASLHLIRAGSLVPHAESRAEPLGEPERERLRRVVTAYRKALAMK